ncbi:MAG: gliding motility-associated C-terminal domain-containing protein, partial [Bacteroidota bacterium]
SAREIFTANPYLIKSISTESASRGQIYQRVPDGGVWASAGTPSINHQVNGPNANCNGGTCYTPSSTGGTCDGSATVTVNGGSGDYSYAWTKDGNSAGNTQTITALCPGEYCVVVTDNVYTGCTSDPVCVTIEDKSVKINPEFDALGQACQNAVITLPILPSPSKNGITGTWDPVSLSTSIAGNIPYKFTPNDPAQCAKDTTLIFKVIPLPVVGTTTNSTIYHNAVYPGNILGVQPAGSTVSWTNNNTTIGLAASGTGNIPAFTAINIGTEPQVATITVKSVNEGCPGTDNTFTITVLPLNRDVFVPNVFTPNGDAKNDLLMVYGNYISKLEMRIFNQWGQLIKVINNPNVGWDGKHDGKPQPVGVYVYTLRATLADGTEVNKKGSITLVR